MTTGIVTVNDGPAITVSTLIGNPMWIPTRVLDLLANAFLSETLLRNAGQNANGMVAFNESTPLYLDDEIEDVAEFGEIPVGSGQIGLPRIVFSTRKGLGIRISKDMKDMNQIGLVQTKMQQLANTFIRLNEQVAFAVLSDTSIPTIAASAAWDTSNGRPRKDIANAQNVIASAVPSASQGDDNMGFNADTLVLPSSITPVLADSDNFQSLYNNSPIVDQSIQYTGKLPNKIMGLDPLQSFTWPSDRVLVLQREVVGFYSDQRPLQSTGLYPEGGGPNGGPRESWRSDTTQRRAMGADQPLAACWVTGVVSD